MKSIGCITTVSWMKINNIINTEIYCFKVFPILLLIIFFSIYLFGVIHFLEGLDGEKQINFGEKNVGFFILLFLGGFLSTIIALVHSYRMLGAFYGWNSFIIFDYILIIPASFVMAPVFYIFAPIWLCVGIISCIKNKLRGKRRWKRKKKGKKIRN